MTIAITSPSSRRRGKTWIDQIIAKIPFDHSLTLTLTTLLLKTHQLFSGHGGLMGACIYTGMVGVTLATTYRAVKLPYPKKLVKKAGWKVVLGLGIVLLLLCSDLSLSAHAFFFDGIQTAIQDVIPAGINQKTQLDTGATFIFGIFKLALIAYIAWNVIKVVGAMREDDTDWKAVAQKPLSIIGIIVGADWLVGLV